MFIINSGVDVSLVAEKLNSSSEGQETDTTTNYHNASVTTHTPEGEESMQEWGGRGGLSV